MRARRLALAARLLAGFQRRDAVLGSDGFSDGSVVEGGLGRCGRGGAEAEEADEDAHLINGFAVTLWSSTSVNRQGSVDDLALITQRRQ